MTPPSRISEKRTQGPNLVAIAESTFHSDSAGRGPVLLTPRSARRLRRPRRCRYGPLLRPAIRRDLARASAHHLTTSRGPRDEALRASGTPTVGSERRVQSTGERARHGRHEARSKENSALSSVPLCVSVVFRPAGWKNPKFEIRNSKFRIRAFLA